MNKVQHSGHRKRMREKLKRTELRTMHDYELLEMLLYYVHPRGDTKQLAKTILQKYKTLHGFLNASDLELKQLEGVGEATILMVKLLRDLYSRVLLPLEGEEVVLNNWGSVFSFCKFTMAHLKEEQLRIFYLNKKHVLIHDEIMSRGTVDRVVAIPREITKRALEVGAMAVILAHNHPSNDLRPSKEDIEITKLIKEALRTLDITLLDHLIITNNDCFSFKANMLV